MERGTVSGPLYVCEHVSFRTVIDSERYRACTDTLRRWYGPEYPRDLITFRPQLLPHGARFFWAAGASRFYTCRRYFLAWMRENFSLPLRFARLLCVCASVGVGAGACRACSHAQRASMRAMVCVARGGSVERRMLWLWRIPHERRCQAPRVHACLCACIPSPISPRPAVRDRLP